MAARSTERLAQVILDPVFRTSPAGAARALWEERQRNLAANGSLMRTHPLGIMCLPLSRDARYDTAAAYSQITHFDPRCTLACSISTSLISGILAGEVQDGAHVDSVIEDAYVWVSKQNPDEDGFRLDRGEFERHVYAAKLESLELDDALKTGYVYKALGAAVFCLRRAVREPRGQTETFERVIADLIMQGGDADTNACCAGALVGAWVGHASLPAHWRDGLRHGRWLEDKTAALCRVLGVVVADRYDGEHDPDNLTDGERGLLPRDVLDKREQDLLHSILTKKADREGVEKRSREEKKRKEAGLLGLGRLF